MKDCSGALRSFLLNNNVAWRADLITITLRDGTVLRFATGETDFTINGVTWFAGGGEQANAPIVKRTMYRQSARLTIDTLDLTLIGPFEIDGTLLGVLATQQYFAGSRVRIDLLVMPTAHDTRYGPINKFFEGQTAQVMPEGYNLTLRLKSELAGLNIMLPKIMLQTQCSNIVYDANCGLNKCDYTHLATVVSATTTSMVVSGLSAYATAYFDLGVLYFTSGTIAGERVAVASGGWDQPSGTITFSMPLTTAPTAGDTINIYPGCNRDKSLCLSRFNNLAQFRGFPHIPQGEAGSV